MTYESSPTEWPERRVDSWSSFVDAIDEVVQPRPKEQNHFLFRGLADHSWKLTPSLLRRIPDSSIMGKENAVRIEKRALNEFQKHAHLHLDSSLLQFAKGDLLGWWSLMQHHKAPTRLLDWSSSPYVAAYFSVQSDIMKDGAIWALDSHRLSDVMRDHYTDFDDFGRTVTPERLFDIDTEPRLYAI